MGEKEAGPEGLEVIVAGAAFEVNPAARIAAHGAIPAVADALIHAASIEGLPILEELRVALERRA